MTQDQTQKKTTTEDLIRYLPLDEDVRKSLLEVYPDKLDDGKYISITRLLWELYYMLYDMRLDMARNDYVSSHKNENLPEDYEDKLIDDTWKYMDQDIAKSQEKSEIDRIRDELKKSLS